MAREGRRDLLAAVGHEEQVETMGAMATQGLGGLLAKKVGQDYVVRKAPRGTLERKALKGPEGRKTAKPGSATRKSWFAVALESQRNALSTRCQFDELPVAARPHQ